MFLSLCLTKRMKETEIETDFFYVLLYNLYETLRMIESMTYENIIAKHKLDHFAVCILNVLYFQYQQQRRQQ